VVPLRIEGRNHYVLFVHPWQANDLKSHPTYEAAQQYANVRGDKNPIFTGALGVWDGVIVHEHEYVPFLDVSAEAGTANFAGDSDGLQAAVDITRAVLCGRQAMAWAKAKYDKGWVEKSFDYDDKDGISTGILCGFQNVSFNSKLYGEIILDTYATPVS
jgi:N4-gp56 family major capsid protein